MKKLGIELFLKSFNLGAAKTVNKNRFFFASIKKAKDLKQPQTKKDDITVDSELTKIPTDPKPQQKINLKNPNIQTKITMTEEQKNELILKQKLQLTYHQLQSLPTDSYETVVENFKKLKGKLMDRKVYIPNKPQLMAKLDQNMQLVKQHHKIWRAPTTSTQRLLSDSKKQIIEWQLQQAKKKYYLSLLENEKVLIACALGVIVLFGGLEYVFYIKQDDKKEEMPKMFI